MDRDKFEALVVKALEDLAPEFQSKLENVDVVVEDYPTPRQLRQMKLRHPNQLLGLYEGIPQTKRGVSYGMVLPDRITVFQKPIEAQCSSDKEIKAAIQEVVRHEIAHHFGSTEETLRRLESRKGKAKNHTKQ